MHVLFISDGAVILTFFAPKNPSQAFTIQRQTPEIRHSPSREVKLLFLKLGNPLILFLFHGLATLFQSSIPQVRMTIFHEDLYILETVGSICHQKSEYPERFNVFFSVA